MKNRLKFFFWKDINGKLQLQEICGSTGEAIDTLSLVIKDNITSATAIYGGINTNISFAVVLHVIDYADQQNTY